MVEATRITATGYDAATLAVALPGEGEVELAKWLDCWGRMAFMDMYMYPLWEKEVHDILQPLYKELTSIFLAYTRSISEVPLTPTPTPNPNPQPLTPSPNPNPNPNPNP